MAIAKRGLLKGIAGIASLGVMPAPLLARSEAGYPRLMQGPMLGAVSETDALVWALSELMLNAPPEPRARWL